jgi:hypothetical protein
LASNLNTYCKDVFPYQFQRAICRSGGISSFSRVSFPDRASLRLAVDATGQLINNPGTPAGFAQSIECRRAGVAEAARKLGLTKAE